MPPFEVIALLLILLPLLGLFYPARKPGPKTRPGPRPLPVIGNLHMLGQNPHRALAKLAQKYGPIMSLRLGHVPTVVVSSAQAAELFLKQYDAVFANRPILKVWDHMVYGAKDVAFTPYGEYWRQMRKVCVVHLLSGSKVAGFEGLRRAETEAAVRRLSKAAEVVDVGERVGELIEAIMFKMVVGKGKEEDKRYDMKGLVRESLALAGAFNLADFNPYLAPLDLQGMTRRIKVTRKATDEIFENIIEDHLKEENFGLNMDILGMLLSLMHNPTNEFFSSSFSFGRDNVKALMFDLFAGGIDTIVVTVTWAISALFKQPRVMKLVQDELDAIVGRERMVVESDLSKLTYLDMVVKETLRLYPAGPLLIPHESMEDVILNEFMIPKKTRVIINFWAIGRDPNVWSENAEEFCPERFMDKDIDVRGQHFELIPFGAGRRVCPGMQLALITVKLIVAQLIHCFDWELPSGMHPEELDMTEKFGLSMPRANSLLARPCYRLQVTH